MGFGRKTLEKPFSTVVPFSDGPSFYEEDPTGRRGVQRVNRRVGLSQQAHGGFCASLTSRSSQWTG